MTGGDTGDHTKGWMGNQEALLARRLLIFTKEMNMNKLEKDGKVAVMISPGFGAGWSTWNSEFRDTLLFDAEIAQAVIDGDKAKAAQLAMEKCPGLCAGGANGLTPHILSESAGTQMFDSLYMKEQYETMSANT